MGVKKEHNEHQKFLLCLISNYILDTNKDFNTTDFICPINKLALELVLKNIIKNIFQVVSFLEISMYFNIKFISIVLLSGLIYLVNLFKDAKDEKIFLLIDCLLIWITFSVFIYYKDKINEFVEKVTIINLIIERHLKIIKQGKPLFIINKDLNFLLKIYDLLMNFEISKLSNLLETYLKFFQNSMINRNFKIIKDLNKFENLITGFALD